jgi:hypothetical protein
MQTQLLQICGKHVIKQVENKFSEGKEEKIWLQLFLGQHLLSRNLLEQH